MFYRTLHWYILRDLIRVFLLTATALTTLLAFGGTFKPLTKEGLDVIQLLQVMINLVPAMLAYAIPMAALFAAVLVYWRLSTDNEITACRAGGISFTAVVVPAIMLGLAVASADLIFVNYVVPMFLQRAERVVRRDLGSLLVQKVARQEPFQYNDMVVYADRGRLLELEDDDAPKGIDKRTVVRLEGMACTMTKDNQPMFIIVAKAANVIFDEVRSTDTIYCLVQLDEGAAFSASTFGRISGNIKSIPPDGVPQPIPSQLKEKVKFLNFLQLQRLNDEPSRYGPINRVIQSIDMALRQQQVAEMLKAGWRPNTPMIFDQGLGGGESVSVTAPVAQLSDQRTLVFRSAGNTPVRVDQYRDGKRIYYYTAQNAVLFMSDDADGQSFNGVSHGTLQLTGDVVRRDLIRNIPPSETDKIVNIQPLVMPTAIVEKVKSIDAEILRKADASQFTPDVQRQIKTVRDRVQKLVREVGSELHSRGAFAISCLMLVMLGAALGILMRGQNPLFVFVVGFVPAIVLVLLMTAGRRVMESSHGDPMQGIAIIWTGNVILVALVIGVYAKLLRQ